MKIIYIDGRFSGAVDATSCEQLEGRVINAESYGKPFRGTPDQMAEDVLHRLHCLLSHVIIDSARGTDEQGDCTARVEFQVVRSLC